jgi:citronellyl-CoA dehydrogenase
MVACIGVSEPAAGSDVSGIKSRARKDGDDYVITGQKMWITNSLQADWMCMLVNTGEGPVHKNKSLVIVPMRENGKLRPGIEVAQKIRKIGMNSSDTGLIYFDEVRVPQRNRIGAEGQGFIYQMQQFQEERPVGRGELPAVADQLHPVDDRVGAGAQAVRRRAGRPAVGAVQAGRDARPRWRRCGR